MNIMLSTSFAQGAWTQKANFGGSVRYAAAGFSIGSKGYIGLGYNIATGIASQDFWEYDPSNNTWTQKANFSGGKRWDVGTFTIGNKGYIVLGMTTSGYVKDSWEYDPLTNSWRKVADYGGPQRQAAFAFSINGKGYCGGGYSSIYRADFWEYDPINDVWTKKADFPGGGRSNACGFAIGNKGYAGTGINTQSYKDFWEYNPINDLWTQKKDFPGGKRVAAVAFSNGTVGYLGTGYDGSNYYNDIWEYNPNADSWNSKVGFCGDKRNFAVGFAINKVAYIGTGINTQKNLYYNDFWEFSSTLDANFTTSSNQICQGQSVNFYNTGSTGACVTHTWNFGIDATPATSTLENPTGIAYSTTGIKNITHIVSSGGAKDTIVKKIMITSVYTDTVKVSICNGQGYFAGGKTQTVSGTYYDSLTTTSCDSIIITTLTVLQPSVYIGDDTIICEGEKKILYAGNFASYRWQDGSVNPSYLAEKADIYYVQVTDSTGCIASDTIRIDVCMEESELWIPNVFTPNKDGKNELFSVGYLNITEFKADIFNRWGQFIYEWNDAEGGWDGTFKGKQCPDGVYVYIIHAKGADHSIFDKTGMITLIR